jgi:hypothetical protein
MALRLSNSSPLPQPFIWNQAGRSKSIWDGLLPRYAPRNFACFIEELNRLLDREVGNLNDASEGAGTDQQDEPVQHYRRALDETGVHTRRCDGHPVLRV